MGLRELMCVQCLVPRIHVGCREVFIVLAVTFSDAVFAPEVSHLIPNLLALEISFQI